MNYIKRLEQENTIKNTTICEARRKLHAIQDYLLSPKFRCGDPLDGYVSTQDMLNMISEVDWFLLEAIGS